MNIELRFDPERIERSRQSKHGSLPSAPCVWTRADLVENFPPNQVIRQVANAKPICQRSNKACGCTKSGSGDTRTGKIAKNDANKSPSDADPAMASADIEKGMADDTDKKVARRPSIRKSQDQGSSSICLRISG